MLRGPKLYPADFALLVALSEPQARRRVAKRHRLPSGAVIVLATVSALGKIDGLLTTRALHNAKLMSPSLLRKYLRELVKARLVERYTSRGRARLRLTVDGTGAAGEYQRHLLAGARQYEREQEIR